MYNTTFIINRISYMDECSILYMNSEHLQGSLYYLYMYFRGQLGLKIVRKNQLCVDRL